MVDRFRYPEGVKPFMKNLKQEEFLDKLLKEFDTRFHKEVKSCQVTNIDDLRKYVDDHCCYLSITRSISGETEITVERGDDSITEVFSGTMYDLLLESRKSVV